MNRIYVSSKDVGKLDKVLSNRQDVHICLIDEDRIMENGQRNDMCGPIVWCPL